MNTTNGMKTITSKEKKKFYRTCFPRQLRVGDLIANYNHWGHIVIVLNVEKTFYSGNRFKIKSFVYNPKSKTTSIEDGEWGGDWDYCCVIRNNNAK